ncbi:KSR2 Kinase, partial [Acromyrmex insinuator]
MAAYGNVEKVRRAMDVAQTMINLAADQLDDLRSQCSVNAPLTQKEIRQMEAKLIKLYSKQLAAKAKLADSLPSDMIQYPLLEQWLRVVGLTEDSIQMVCSKVNTIEALKEKSELELKGMLNENCIYYKEECRRLCKALDILWQYTDILIRGGTEKNDSDLYWDSWDSLRKEICPKPILSRTTRCSIPSESSIPYHNNNNDVLIPASAISTSFSISSNPPCISLPKRELEYEVKPLPPEVKTPPPCRKHLISVQKRPLQSEVLPLAKSKSHESQLANRRLANIIQSFDNDDISFSFRNNSSVEKNNDSPIRRNLPAEQNLDCGTTDSGKEESPLSSNSSPIKSPIKSPLSIKSPVELPIELPFNHLKSSIKSPIKSPVKSPVKSFVRSHFKSPPPPPICTTNPESDDNLEGTGTSLQVPNSPSTPGSSRGMSHAITHRFTKCFNMMTVCDYCERPVFVNTLRCKECKYRCHPECLSKVPSSCGIPRKFVAAFKRSIQSLQHSLNVSPVLKRTGMTSSNNVDLLPPLNRKDRRRSYTQSSTNIPVHGDSNLNTFSHNRSTPSSPALLSTTVSHSTHSFLKQFHFPDVMIKKEALSGKLHEKRYKSESAISNDNRRKTDMDDTSDSEVSKRVDSQESLSSDSEIVENPCRWPRQNSVLMQEWDILYSELKVRNLIGKGRFATVHRGFWHGDTAIKILNMSYYSEDEKTLETFRLEARIYNYVATYRIARHDNIILFLGVCTKPPQLALVTSLSRGISLYTCLHIRKDRFTLSEINSIAQQICQVNMKIIYKYYDLRSKNVFVENGKVVISDFGLFNITKLCHGNRKGEPLNIPPGWLCYLAPEIVRRLKPLNRGQDKLPYSIESDVYAFGDFKNLFFDRTIWYELLCGEWPFRGQPTEAIIWQVGKGMKQSLSYLQASRDVKDVLMYCWSYHAKRRLDFIEIIILLKRLSRKKLARSSSNPTNCTRSAESMF